MAIDIPRQEYTGSVQEITLGSGPRAITVGGDTAYPFYTFEGDMPHAPRIGIQVPDYAPDDWADACAEPYRDVLGDPVAWAKKAQDEYGADFIQLWLKSTDPNGLDRSADEAAETAKAVAEAVSVPLIVWGTANVDKDAEVLGKVAEACADHQVIIGPVEEANHKQIGAQALAYNLKLVASSPIDINLAKQLNILLTNLGVPLENIIIDPTTGALGYGLEYTYSVMERIRQAALTQDDDKLQCPFLSNMADEVWKCKEAKLPTDEHMGEAKSRGVLMEAVTATTLLNAGAELLVMRHPEAIQLVREYIAELGGFEMPRKEAAAAAQKAAQPRAEIPAEVSGIAEALEQGALCRIVKCMDTPVELAPGHAIALIKVLDKQDAAAEGGLILTSLKEAAAQKQAEEAEAPAEAPKTTLAKQAPEFVPADTWTPISEDDNYECVIAEEENVAGSKVRVMRESYEPGKASEKYNWRDRVDDPSRMLQRVKTDLRYWYSEGYGSERRKKPA